MAIALSDVILYVCSKQGLNSCLLELKHRLSYCSNIYIICPFFVINSTGMNKNI